MISLKQDTSPYEIELIAGLKLTLKPLRTIDMAVAQAAAKKRVDDLEKSIKLATESGFCPERSLDFSDPAQRHALYMELLIKELAMRQILSWAGVEDPAGGTDAPLTPENICALMEVYPIGELFYTSLTVKYYLMVAAKEECGTALRGISSPAAVPNTAEDAPKTDFLVH